ncbi:aminopeptidase C [Corynebacterium phoceense]|uniref:aminopeptidase C n=1 Tax=Corynebacterium phoceense TaxID=1686286 RepID=UPI0018AC4E35|nr:C1 family peptidase [Corynebacterium phoceense]MBF9010904.1 C1 family peptidase [Corynebacterium phoceense]
MNNAQLDPQSIAARNAELAQDPTLTLLRNAAAGTSLDQVLLDHTLATELTPAVETKVDKWSAANQKQSGRCWIFAGLNSLRGPVMDTANIKDFEFSQTYIHFFDKLEKANYFLTAMEELADRDINDRTIKQLLDSPIDDGGQWSMFIAIVEKYGVVPQYAMPETASSNQTRLMNRNLETVLHRAAMRLRAAAETERAGIHEQALRDCYRILVTNLGVPPENFEWAYRDKDNEFHREGTFTPQEFAARMLPADLSEYVCVVNDPRNAYGELYTVDHLGNVVGKDVTYLNVPSDVLRQAAFDSLQDGAAVWFGCDTDQQSNGDAGIWAAKLYDYESAFGIKLDIDKADRLRTHESLMTHAMVLTGVDAPNGQPTRWRVENSWGTDKADKGFWTMRDDWFDEYVFEIAVHPSRLPEEYQKALSSEHVNTLPAWDPMGALA